MEFNNGNKANSMKKIEKQNDTKENKTSIVVQVTFFTI